MMTKLRESVQSSGTVLNIFANANQPERNAHAYDRVNTEEAACRVDTMYMKSDTKLEKSDRGSGRDLVSLDGEDSDVVMSDHKESRSLDGSSSEGVERIQARTTERVMQHHYTIFEATDEGVDE